MKIKVIDNRPTSDSVEFVIGDIHIEVHGTPRDSFPFAPGENHVLVTRRRSIEGNLKVEPVFHANLKQFKLGDLARGLEFEAQEGPFIYVLHSDGKKTWHPYPKELEDWQELVGGLIEVVYVKTEEPDALLLIVNEEGLVHGLPYNPEATRLANSNGDTHHIVGPAIVLHNDAAVRFLCEP